jgi:hypothetical protein
VSQRLQAYRWLQVGLGVLCATSGLLKIISLGGSGMHNTLIWSLVGGSRSALIALSAGEVVYGSLLTFGVARRLLASLGALAVAASTVAFFVLRVRGETRPCGCFGEVGHSLSASTLGFLVRNAVIIVGMVLLLREAWPSAPDQLHARAELPPGSP